MAKPVNKHQDDDGDISIFASGDLVVLACENGHYWVVESKLQSSDGVKSALEELLPADEALRLYQAF